MVEKYKNFENKSRSISIKSNELNSKIGNQFNKF